MDWNEWVRQTHSWLSIVFTMTVVANFAAMALGKASDVARLFAIAPSLLDVVHGFVHVRVAVCCQMARTLSRGSGRAS